MAQEHMVITGGGLAGATAAKTLRAEGYAGPITLLGAENRIPYIRPPLSKEFLLGKVGEEAVEVAPASWYAENDVEFLPETPVTGIDPQGHSVTLANARNLTYSALLLATGAQPRTVPIPGIDLDGVMTFRTFGDSLRLRAHIKDGGRNVVMIGSGWIGMELAAAARAYGNEVTLLGLEDIPLSAALGPELGTYFQHLHSAHGVNFRLPASASRIEGKNGGVTAVHTNTGETLQADVVVVAVGVLPDTSLAERAGLALRNGILVDAGLHTSAPDVFAAGDAANAFHPFIGEHQRSEHWANALNGGKIAAQSMLGQDAVLDAVPYFYTDQFDLSMEYSGFPSLATGRVPVIRGSLDDGSFLAFWLRDDRLVAGMSVNQRRVQKSIKALISGRVRVDAGSLTDPGMPLEELLPH
ncbi:NADPH-dependent 2,4-dienoyl-CoA reductase/sulfur reductase-like enzyme [Paenarthrobacter nitroguajacolicus]|uniref:NAD(P)/FAD-dependent oxidoreductase n=1 Tax=Paenarthrobacter TaxID=1742992 RepID=UPI0028677F27|nr:FAD-dependent oxidoreductase [Paenarthrobacter nitroguajacolicus]MDR6989019.1 NADPH-dependent 2,4-dienoyl-CoA reductase/sulfur reductase-like enzyme [Paenarthrobacter nitroguajacolicus]